MIRENRSMAVLMAAVAMGVPLDLSGERERRELKAISRKERKRRKEAKRRANDSRRKNRS